MKNIKIITVWALTLVLLSMSATAQQGSVKLDLNYNYGIPVGKFKSDLVNNNSPRGFIAALMYEFNSKLKAGLAFGHQDYYQKYPRSVYPLSKTQDVSAVLTNSIQTTPFLLEAKYSPLDNSFVKPYILAGAGLNIVDFKQYLGEFGSGQTNGTFMAQGGLGVLFPFRKFENTGIDIGANYNLSPYKKLSYYNLNSVNVYAGITFNIR